MLKIYISTKEGGKLLVVIVCKHLVNKNHCNSSSIPAIIKKLKYSFHT